MATTPSVLVHAGGGSARWTSGLLGAAGGKFGLLLVALVALMGAAPLIPSPGSEAVLTLFTGAVLVASLHAARPGGRPVAIGFALALADCLIGRCTAYFGTRWLVLLQTVLWLSTLIYVIATILRAIFASREVTVQTLLAALCVFLLIGLFGAFAFTLIDLALPGSFSVSHGPGLVWEDEQSRATEFMRLFVFSYATLSGSSWAEVAPATGFARNAASLEAMAGQIYLAVVVARLIGLHIAPPAVDPVAVGAGTVCSPKPAGRPGATIAVGRGGGPEPKEFQMAQETGTDSGSPGSSMKPAAVL
jgi:hypothetical protein